MKSSDIVRELCKKTDISISELARRINQSPQNFNKKLKRDTLTTTEMIEIAHAVGATYEQLFVLNDGKIIELDCGREADNGDR